MSSDLATLRERIAAIKIDQAALNQAPLPRADVFARIDADLAHRLQHLPSGCNGMSWVWPDRGALHLVNQDPKSAEALIIWLHGDALRKRLRAEVDSVLEGLPAGLTDAQRREQELKLSRELFDLELAEERLISAAESQGRFIARRPDADPRALVEVAGE
jgi:hypothetical protein